MTKALEICFSSVRYAGHKRRLVLKIVRKRYSDWDTKIKRRLRRATFEDGFIRKYIPIAPDSPTFVAFSKKQVMGWIFVFQLKGENDVNIFVNERYRGRGIGTRLIQAVLKYHSPILLAVWDEVTQELFPKLKKQYPDQIAIIDWDVSRAEYQALVDAHKKQK